MMDELIRFDWAMKTLLRDKANFDVLLGFLCSLLEDNDLKIIQLLEDEPNQCNSDDTFNLMDLIVEDTLGRKILIEIQNNHETDYLERRLFGCSKIVVDHQRPGRDFKDIRKVVSISILYFDLGSGDDYLYHGTTEFRGMHTGHHLVVKKGINISKTFEPKYKFVEKSILPEFYFINVECYDNIIKNRIDEWIYVIKNGEIAEGSTSKNIDKAREKLAEVNMTEVQRKRYEKYLINLARDRDVLNTAKKEGEEIGIKKAMQKEIEKGKEDQAIKIAKIMFENGESIQKIATYTGLRIEQLEKLFSS